MRKLQLNRRLPNCATIVYRVGPYKIRFKFNELSSQDWVAYEKENPSVCSANVEDHVLKSKKFSKFRSVFIWSKKRVEILKYNPKTDYANRSNKQTDVYVYLRAWRFYWKESSKYVVTVSRGWNRLIKNL